MCKGTRLRCNGESTITLCKVQTSSPLRSSNNDHVPSRAETTGTHAYSRLVSTRESSESKDFRTRLKFRTRWLLSLDRTGRDWDAYHPYGRDDEACSHHSCPFMQAKFSILLQAPKYN